MLRMRSLQSATSVGGEDRQESYFDKMEKRKKEVLDFAQTVVLPMEYELTYLPNGDVTYDFGPLPTGPRKIRPHPDWERAL